MTRFAALVVVTLAGVGSYATVATAAGEKSYGGAHLPTPR
jgi:hypothetical protein